METAAVLVAGHVRAEGLAVAPAAVVGIVHSVWGIIARVAK